MLETPLPRRSGLNPDDASTHLMRFCAPHLARTRRPWLLALTGLPGSGKSTLARTLTRQARREGWPALALSLDDFYLPRQARKQLAARIHPLLITRGVPGTHDLALLRHVLSRLPHASAEHPVAIPRFDKSRDTRCAPSHWQHVRNMPRLLILEGWCLGIAPRPAQTWRRPINALEREEDPDGTWRQRIRRQLPDYLRLWHAADARARIRVPDWPSVCRLRREAEQARHAQQAPRAMDDTALARFLAHYERLGRTALKHPPDDVDVTFTRRS